MLLTYLSSSLYDNMYVSRYIVTIEWTVLNVKLLYVLTIYKQAMKINLKWWILYCGMFYLLLLQCCYYLLCSSTAIILPNITLIWVGNYLGIMTFFMGLHIVLRPKLIMDVPLCHSLTYSRIKYHFRKPA